MQQQGSKAKTPPKKGAHLFFRKPLFWPNFFFKNTNFAPPPENCAQKKTPKKPIFIGSKRWPSYWPYHGQVIDPKMAKKMAKLLTLQHIYIYIYIYIFFLHTQYTYLFPVFALQNQLHAEAHRAAPTEIVRAPPSWTPPPCLPIPTSHLCPLLPLISASDNLCRHCPSWKLLSKSGDLRIFSESSLSTVSTWSTSWLSSWFLLNLDKQAVLFLD